MELTTEQYEDLPEYARGAFAESDGKYIPVKDATLKATLDNLDKEKRNLESRVGELTKSEEVRLTELESAKQQARDEAIREAASKGNWEEQERLLREKFDDELKRKLEEERGNVTKEFTAKQSSESLSSDIKLLATKYAVDSDAIPIIEMALERRAKIDDGGNRVYYGEDGSALSLTNLDEFGVEFAKSPSMARLIKADLTTNGTGQLDGGQKGGAQGGQNQAAEKAKNAGDLTGFLRASLTK